MNVVNMFVKHRCGNIVTRLRATPILGKSVAIQRGCGTQPNLFGDRP